MVRDETILSEFFDLSVFQETKFIAMPELLATIKVVVSGHPCIIVDRSAFKGLRLLLVHICLGLIIKRLRIIIVDSDAVNVFTHSKFIKYTNALGGASISLETGEEEKAAHHVQVDQQQDEVKAAT